MTWAYFPHYWPFVRVIPRLPVDCHPKGSVMQDFDFSFWFETAWYPWMRRHCNVWPSKPRSLYANDGLLFQWTIVIWWTGSCGYLLFLSEKCDFEPWRYGYTQWFWFDDSIIWCNDFTSLIMLEIITRWHFSNFLWCLPSHWYTNENNQGFPKCTTI